MAIQFPASPTLNDTYTDGNGTVWTWDGTAWKSASTTISAFGGTLVDDADAATARTTLGAVGSTDITTIVVLTQAAYDLLTPASDTLYVIVG